MLYPIWHGFVPSPPGIPFPLQLKSSSAHRNAAPQLLAAASSTQERLKGTWAAWQHLHGCVPGCFSAAAMGLEASLVSQRCWGNAAPSSPLAWSCCLPLPSSFAGRASRRRGAKAGGAAAANGSKQAASICAGKLHRLVFL